MSANIVSINSDRLVMQSVMGEVHHPAMGPNPYRINTVDGMPMVQPGTGGITYNVSIGDSVYAMEADHVEPGVSIKASDTNENNALNTLSCIGNEARVISGEAKGAKGFVTGKHGGIEHVLVYFERETLEKMAIGDKILIKAQGQGMKLMGFEDKVKAMNIDPALYYKLNITSDNGMLNVPVAAKIPAYLMGSGIGSNSAYRGDYDIMTADREVIKNFGLDKLRYGDIVMLENCDTTFGRGYLTGAATIGVVVHSDCILAGHGPGVTTLLTAKSAVINGVITPNANIAGYLLG